MRRRGQRRFAAVAGRRHDEQPGFPGPGHGLGQRVTAGLELVGAEGEQDHAELQLAAVGHGPINGGHDRHGVGRPALARHLEAHDVRARRHTGAGAGGQAGEVRPVTSAVPAVVVGATVDREVGTDDEPIAELVGCGHTGVDDGDAHTPARQATVVEALPGGRENFDGGGRALHWFPLGTSCWFEAGLARSVSRGARPLRTINPHRRDGLNSSIRERAGAATHSARTRRAHRDARWRRSRCWHGVSCVEQRRCSNPGQLITRSGHRNAIRVAHAAKAFRHGTCDRQNAARACAHRPWYGPGSRENGIPLPTHRTPDPAPERATTAPRGGRW